MTKLQKRKNGQYVITIPKEIALAYGLEDGDELEWSIESRNALRVTINQGGDSGDE
jgi:bifunctional DNA-binding transcriptional regulator/antitoxin component of YhaV-PrlF toxin-antitoxin module